MWAWIVRHIDWCLLCQTRECNGKGAELCARCQAAIETEMEEVLNG